MTDETVSALRQRQENAAAIAAERSVIPDNQSGMTPDPTQDAAGKGNRGGRGTVPVRVGNEFTSRRLFDLHATLSDGYTPR